MNIVLIGFMCSGKSRVGKMLAHRLAWDFVDTDDLIVKQTGKSIAELINTEGEAAFRSVEKNAVKTAANRARTIIATGGGVPVDPDNMAALSKEGKIVWLRVQPETVLKRAGNLSSRPLIDPKNPLESIRQRMSQREPYYAQARNVIDTDEGNPQAVVDKIISFFPSALS